MDVSVCIAVALQIPIVYGGINRVGILLLQTGQWQQDTYCDLGFDEMPNNLLITGESGDGKSFALSSAADSLGPMEIAGFLGPREAGLDSSGGSGWRIDVFNGVTGLLAHSSIQTRHSIGRLGVDMELFDRCIASDEYAASSTASVVTIDEIGIISGWPIEFQRLVESALDSTAPTVAIVRQKPGDFSDRIKSRDDVEIWTVTLGNREFVSIDIAKWVRARIETRV